MPGHPIIIVASHLVLLTDRFAIMSSEGVLGNSHLENLPSVDQSSKQARHKVIKKTWTADEDDLIRKLVKEYGPRNWTRIARFVPGRLGKQCRERWYNHLDPSINKEEWTNDEEWVLYLLHTRHGNKWAQISKHLPGRTDNSVKNHWNSTMRKKIARYEEMLNNVSQGRDESFVTDAIYKDIESQSISVLRLKLDWLPALVRKATSNRSNVSFTRYSGRKLSKNQDFLMLRRNLSSHSISNMMSPPRQDPFQSTETDNEDFAVEPDPCDNMTKNISFLVDDRPLILFRNFSLKQCEAEFPVKSSDDKENRDN